MCLQRSLETQKWVSVRPQAQLKKNEKEKEEEQEAKARKDGGEELTSSDEANAFYCEQHKPII